MTIYQGITMCIGQVTGIITVTDHASGEMSPAGGLSAGDLLSVSNGDVRGLSRAHHRQIGTLGIISKKEMAESWLHHLMQDVRVKGSVHAEQAPARQAGQNLLRRQPHCRDPDSNKRTCASCDLCFMWSSRSETGFPRFVGS